MRSVTVNGVLHFHINRKDLTLLRLHRRRQPPDFEHPVPPGRHSSPNLFPFPCPTGAKESDTQNMSIHEFYGFTVYIFQTEAGQMETGTAHMNLLISV